MIVCDTGAIVAAAIKNDIRPGAELVFAYWSLPLGTTDATVIALRERLGLLMSPG